MEQQTETKTPRRPEVLTNVELLARCKEWILGVWPYIMPDKGAEYRVSGRELLTKIDARMARTFTEDITRHMR